VKVNSLTIHFSPFTVTLKVNLYIMNKIRNYFQESYHELVHKVSWPTWQELQSSTMIVLIATVIITLIVWGMDALSNVVLTQYYKLF